MRTTTTIPSIAIGTGGIRSDELAELPPGTRLTAHSTEWPEDVTWIEIAPGVELPEEFAYREAPRGGEPLATIFMRVIDGQVVCERIELEPATTPTGQHTPLTASAVHDLPLGRLLRAAPVQVARVTLLQPEPDSPDEMYWERQRLAVSMIAKQRGKEDPVRAAVRPRGRREPIPMDDRELGRVADTYRAAARLGQAPTEAVRVAYSVSRSTASRWVRRARDAGHLGEAIPRRAGEAVPDS